MTSLRVRVYNVRFGDAVLISIPERDGAREVTRHLLIDMGNVLSTSGGDDAVFEPVMRDILEVLDGAPLSLYVMTHEHLDHVQGLLYASEQLELELPGTERSWLTASSALDYYESHPDAKRALDIASRNYEAVRLHFAANKEDELPTAVRAMLANNDALMKATGSSKTAQCVDFLRRLTPNTTYVHRQNGSVPPHPLREAELEVWAPEEDTSAYYGRFDPSRLRPLEIDPDHSKGIPIPPPGVDAGAFYNLVELRRGGHSDNLLAIDKAANNTSVVLALEWRGWRLLFPGDAEERSWQTMEAAQVLKPVHFYKVGHHGSHNGTPSEEILEKILPARPPDDRPRRAVVSTCSGTYNNVPDDATLERLGSRCSVHSTMGLEDGEYVDIEFEG
jgi:beta-lactamase superfamily II metal-dependent hydrolase